MAQRRRKTDARREPTFHDGGKGQGGGLRVHPSDRPGYVNPRGEEPHLDERDDEPVDAKPRSRGSRKKEQSKDRPFGRTRRHRRSLLGGLIYWALVLAVWSIIGVSAVIAYHAAKLPPIDQLAVPKRPPNVAILASDGTLLVNRGETGGQEVPITELPTYLPKAFIAIEDRRFYSHFGIDPIGIGRALFRNVMQSNGAMQGGSTLTQQLAKNIFLTQERTAARKIQEAILALWLERNYSKDQILELYLNRVYFGSGAYGIEAAAQRYFGKSARQVTLAEAAMLGGLVQAPTRLAPNRNPEAAKARAELVLAAMVREGFVSQAKAGEAEAAPAVALSTQRGASGNYPADYVMDRIDELIGTVDTDLVVTTTLDPALQGFAEQALVAELDAKGAKYGVSQGAFVAMAPDGSIRALVGGRNYTESQYNRAVTAKRQPGSAFKPFVYLTALEKGLTPNTIREDGPLNVKGWKPENYSREYFGPVTLTNALALSLNTVAVRVGMEVGPRNVAATARRLGIYSKLDVNASLALGTSEVTPLEMVSAYGAFANGGYLVEPRIIREIRTREGEVIFTRADPAPVQVIAPPILAMLNTMMRETLVSGTGKKAELPGWEAAGKTGTSQDFRDAWFIGYTGTLVAGVWLGNDDGSATKRVTGGNLPVEIWSKFMKSALGPVKPVPLPASDDPVTNLLSGWKFPWDPATDSAPRPPGSIPQP